MNNPRKVHRNDETIRANFLPHFRPVQPNDAGRRKVPRQLDPGGWPLRYQCDRQRRLPRRIQVRRVLEQVSNNSGYNKGLTTTLTGVDGIGSTSSSSRVSRLLPSHPLKT